MSACAEQWLLMCVSWDSCTGCLPIVCGDNTCRVAVVQQVKQKLTEICTTVASCNNGAMQYLYPGLEQLLRLFRKHVLGGLNAADMNVIVVSVFCEADAKRAVFSTRCTGLQPGLSLRDTSCAASDAVTAAVGAAQTPLRHVNLLSKSSSGWAMVALLQFACSAHAGLHDRSPGGVVPALALPCCRSSCCTCTLSRTCMSRTTYPSWAS